MPNPVHAIPSSTFYSNHSTVTSAHPSAIVASLQTANGSHTHKKKRKNGRCSVDGTGEQAQVLCSQFQTSNCPDSVTSGHSANIAAPYAAGQSQTSITGAFPGQYHSSSTTPSDHCENAFPYQSSSVSLPDRLPNAPPYQSATAISLSDSCNNAAPSQTSSAIASTDHSRNTATSMKIKQEVISEDEASAFEGAVGGGPIDDDRVSFIAHNQTFWNI